MGRGTWFVSPQLEQTVCWLSFSVFLDLDCLHPWQDQTMCWLSFPMFVGVGYLVLCSWLGLMTFLDIGQTEKQVSYSLFLWMAHFRSWVATCRNLWIAGDQSRKGATDWGQSVSQPIGNQGFSIQVSKESAKSDKQTLTQRECCIWM